MDAFFAPVQQPDVERVVSAFRQSEVWVQGPTLMQRLDPARNNGIRAQLTAIDRACRAGRIYAEERRVHPRSIQRVICYRLS